MVALNTDAGVARLKGPARPVNPLADRAAVISALAAVDAVGTYIMGFNPRSIPHIRMAEEVGIGPIDLSQITVSNGSTLTKDALDGMVVPFDSPFPKGW